MPTNELDDLRGVVRDYLAATSPSGTVRSLMATETGYDEHSWRQMAVELGLHGVAVPERWGGAGAGTVALAVVFEEMGHALSCSPFFATIGLATQAVLASEDDAAAEQLIPGFIDGSSTATLILNGELGAWDPDAVTLVADGAGGGYRIHGVAPLVIDGHTADIVLVAARTTAGISLFAVRAGSDGLRRTPLAGLDRTRKVARVQFDGAQAELIGTDGGAANFLARTSDLALVALTAEQVGAAQRCLDMAVDYAKNRIQFGRAIGSFQAVKHRCADMLIQVEGARSAESHAAEVAGTDDLPTAVSVAKMVCSEAFLQVALDNMRIHGGIGFTWEHDAHLYVRRAKVSQLIFGDPDYHAQRLATLVSE
ncbi:acyl-CoA dehydrogenase family protein [Mycobacterium marseillense]|uniref:Acyl-CoA dehydrogenase n=1 Tax=Mycobacterium marseillense TaxID=701042 RepID=A0AAC9VU40_9MYCO|nr:acyl-CoA dehydrogenase family protein [Mycobacterium marseillense]ASW89871.1 acyl-CoA dehydrogenase [Mycobacterium marseillense]MCA2262423.1 acyl-CoA/acyl-ACP dehydrogenase [Mycobacterium marseillense]MCV7404359.1 acyl-CoA/acyl-ACP dehydrogenase [Mycobacterium marseillense]MDM3973637.1 acyl-CoA dehydrogenase family protein [Mycobacterium marseillense]OBJ76588.1 acyl-CoA dehydrogenase [Mycobacterium marseillense]